MLRRLALAGLAAALFASCSSGKEGSSPGLTTLLPNTTTSALPTTPVIGRALSPDRASVQGSGGKGMVVALTFTARDATVLPATFRIGGALPAPAAPAKPGVNPAFPGLVVGLSTTGSALGGPSANLANLFQIVSPSLQLDGSAQVTAVWTNGSVDFGTDVETTLTAFVVSGTAPEVIPPTLTNVDVISNTLDVTFRISPLTGAAPAAPSVTAVYNETTTSKPGATTTTSSTVKASTTVAPTTTRVSTTTTVPPTTTTTKFLGLF